MFSAHPVRWSGKGLSGLGFHQRLLYSKVSFGLQIAQDDSNLASGDGAPSYNVLARTSNKNFRKALPTIQRLSAILPDSNLEI